MNLLISWLISALAVLAAAYLLPGIQVASFTAALVTALALGIVNAVLKPLFLLLTLPLNIITFGLFTLVVNASLVMLAAYIVPGFIVDNFWWALLFSLVLALINSFLHRISKD